MGKTVCIVQARMGSERLPGKVLLDIMGKPMLEHIVERLKAAKSLARIVVATTDKPADKPVVALAQRLGIGCFAGDEHDVLSRYLGAAKKYGAETVVRVTGDCPLIDPVTIDRIVEEFRRSGADYVSNTLQRTYPRGLDVEVFSFESLQKADSLAEPGSYREHVTLYMYRHPEEFNLLNVSAEPPLDRSDIRLCVDTKEDFALVDKVYITLGRPGKIIDINEVMTLFKERPELIKINEHIEQKKV